MKRLLSIQYSDGMFNFSMLLLRLAFGGLMLLNHGMDKLMHFSAYESKFYNFMGMGSRASLVLAIFAEVFCSLFIVLGLFTRFAAIPLLITMLIAIFVAHAGQFAKAEMAVLYCSAFFVLLFCGPGKVSVDGMMRG
ncbi:putative oxidoreductase [Filimonas zeae]|nr:DoxX family protein [Filimonas zeae]MDR6337295.1 putative oxidoreductase [Filimonas zeae]